MAFLSGALMLIPCVLQRTRLPSNEHARAALDLKALGDIKYGMTTLAMFFVEFAIFVPLTYISSYAIHTGIDYESAYRLIAYLNAASILGRAVPGYFADRHGGFNIMIFTTSVCSLFILVQWLLSNNDKASITIFAVMFGFWSGTAVSLGPVCIAQVCRIEDYGKRTGTTFAICSFGALLGPPVAGAILNSRGTNYLGLIGFGGALYIASSITFAVTRAIAGGWAFKIVF